MDYLGRPNTLEEFEEKYAELFSSDTGNVAKPLRMALGALIIHFIGLSGYQDGVPFEAS